MRHFYLFSENVAEWQPRRNTGNIISVFRREENIVGKKENAGHQHFLLFPYGVGFAKIDKFCCYLCWTSLFDFNYWIFRFEHTILSK